jgi:hypothetical protein
MLILILAISVMNNSNDRSEEQVISNKLNTSATLIHVEISTQILVFILPIKPKSFHFAN